MPERLSNPKWPQSLALIAGEKRQFVFPLTAEGKMEGQVRWEGPPLDIRLYRPDGSEALALKNQLPPCASLQWEAGRPDRGQLPLWKLSVQPSEADRAEPVQGEVHLTLPRLLKSQERALMDQVQGQGLVLDDRWEDLLDQFRDDLRLSVPVISQVVPAEGFPGTQVTLTGQNFGPNIDCVTAFFFHYGYKFPAANIALYQENDEDHLIVTVPLDFQTVVYDLSQGGVWLESTLFETAKSTPVPFLLFPARAPQLDSAEPQFVSEGQVVTVHGRYFGVNPQELAVEFSVHGSIHTAPVQTVTDTEFTALVPAYTTVDNELGTLRAKRLYPCGWVPSNHTLWLTFHARTPVIYEYYASDIYTDPHTLSPNGSLMIAGTGFGDAPGKIFINHLPGQNPGDQVIWLPNMEMEVISWSDTLIVAKLVNNDYFPFEAEFQVVTSDANNTTNRTPWYELHIKPVYETKYIHFCNPYVEAHQPSAWTGTPDDEWNQLANGTGIQVIHRAGFFNGRSDDDHFFRNFTLQNHFHVASVTLNKYVPSPGEADAYVVESHEGSNTPYVRVHWWNSPIYDHIFYSLSILLRGPRGYDYQ